MISKFIRKIETKRLERNVDHNPSKYIVILVPGFFGRASRLIPLKTSLDRLFDKHDIDAKVLIHSNGLLTGKFSEMTDALRATITNDIDDSDVIIIAHSFGGRIASQVVSELAPIYPNKNFLLITNATILGERPVGHIVELKILLYSLVSASIRDWDRINLPNKLKNVECESFYSDGDELIRIEYVANERSHSEITHVYHGLTHQEMISPKVLSELFLYLENWISRQNASSN